MGKSFRILALIAGGGVMASVVVVVANQTAQVVQLASTVHPDLGRATLWGLVAAYAASLGVPIVLFLRLPRALVPPATAEGPEFEAYLKRLAGRLEGSPHLAGVDLSGRAGIDAALGVLDRQADAIVRRTASAVFLSTAVSQSGRLDGLLVLAAQSRMVWRVAHLYRQRPSPAELARLYAGVAATVFVAGELDDIDLGEQVEPILSSALGAFGASVPGFQVAGTVLANCVLAGAANAFLTLRVGTVARMSCGATTAPRRSDLRRAATREAARHLGGIVSDGTRKLVGAAVKATKDKIGGAFAGASEHVKETTRGWTAWMKGDRPGQEVAAD